MAESVTNTGNIVGKIDQHMGKNESPAGYKYQYVNVDKNKKLGLIHKGNVNSVLYNLLWDIVSHQVDNETAKGEMKEINWIMKRFPKDEDRDDDTGVSNNTIHKYLDKARDIVKNMKETVSEEVYVVNGRLTKRSSDEGKKLSEEVDEEVNKESLCSKYDLKFPNGSDVVEDIDLTAAVMYMYGLNGKEAREGIRKGEYSEKDLQKAINYWVEKTDGNRNWNEEEKGKNESQSTTAQYIRDDLISCGANSDDIKDYIDFCKRKKYITEGQAKDLMKELNDRKDEEMNEERTSDSVYKVIKNGLIDGGNPEEDIREYIDHCAKKKYITKEQKESLIKYLEAREKYGLSSDEDKLNEDSMVGKYFIKKIKENGVEKYGVYDQSGNLRATYPDEQTAKDAVQGKKVFEEKSSKMNEEYNPFKDLKKVKDKEYRKGLYTDGKGYYYEVPKTGASKWVKKKNYKFRYNFEKREVEVADNAGDVIYTSGLSVGNWLDGPDYWYDKIFKDMQDEDDAWIEEYFRQHPEVDKRNISVEHLKEDKTDGIECNDSKRSEKSKTYKIRDAKQELDEADDTVKFSSVDELSKYLSDKDSVIIYYDGKQYQILDEDIEDEGESDES